MPKVLCTLPNASEEISGVKFVTHAKGMLSEEIDDEQAAHFTSIPGYEIVGATAAPAAASEDQADPAKEEKADLAAKLSALGVTVKSNWGVDRLKAEIEKAEKAASEQTGDAAASE